MEKVRIDTEIRKLDQLRAAYLNHLDNIRWELRHLPRDIADARKTLQHLQTNILTRCLTFSSGVREPTPRTPFCARCISITHLRLHRV